LFPLSLEKSNKSIQNPESQRGQQGSLAAIFKKKIAPTENDDFPQFYDTP